MTRRILVDRARCIGAGTCVLESPGTFALDADDRVVVIAEPSPDTPDVVRLAVEGCPVRALRFEGDAGADVSPGQSNSTVA